MAQHRNDALKTPTSILFNKAENFNCFGYKTEKKYAQLAEKAQEEQDSKEDVESDDNDDKKDEEKNTALQNAFTSEDLKWSCMEIIWLVLFHVKQYEMSINKGFEG